MTPGPTPDRTAVVVVTHDRPVELQACVAGWANTLPGWRAVYVVANSPCEVLSLRELPRCYVLHTWQREGHVGCLSKSWNFGWLWAFGDPEVEWVACSQDDVEIHPGWREFVAEHPAELYMAPSGDNVFLLSRAAFRAVGWFDERFAVIGYHEWDWVARALRALGRERVVIEDGHGWAFNAVGLSSVWLQNTAQRVRPYRAYLDVGAAWLREKWGLGPDDFVRALRNGDVPEPLIPEIEWYPWFTK